MKALRKLSEEGKKFDLVYLDPPYAKQKNNTVMAFLNDHQMMNPRGRVVIESLKEDEFRENYSNLKYVKDTIYGITRITYYQAEV
jgi:16S rRNA (guanine966-N2)-methyltransferase